MHIAVEHSKVKNKRRFICIRDMIELGKQIHGSLGRWSINITINNRVEEFGMQKVFDEVNVQVHIGTLAADCQVLLTVSRLVQTYGKAI